MSSFVPKNIFLPVICTRSVPFMFSVPNVFSSIVDLDNSKISSRLAFKTILFAFKIICVKIYLSTEIVLFSAFKIILLVFKGICWLEDKSIVELSLFISSLYNKVDFEKTYKFYN